MLLRLRGNESYWFNMTPLFVDNQIVCLLLSEHGNPNIPLWYLKPIKITTKATLMSFHRNSKKWPIQKAIGTPDLVIFFTFLSISTRFQKMDQARIRQVSESGLLTNKFKFPLCFFSKGSSVNLKRGGMDLSSQNL